MPNSQHPVAADFYTTKEFFEWWTKQQTDATARLERQQADITTRIEKKLDQVVDSQVRFERSFAEKNYDRRIDGLEHTAGQHMVRLDTLETFRDEQQAVKRQSKALLATMVALYSGFIATIAVIVDALFTGKHP